MTRIKLILVLISISRIAFAQDYKLNVGGGFPDITHLGVSFELDSIHELSVQFGFLPLGEELIIAPAIEHQLSLRKSSKYADLTAWYLSQRIIYNYDVIPDEEEFHLVSYNLSIGRHFCFSEHYGMSLDLGIFFKLFEKDIDLNLTEEEIREPEPTPDEDLFPAYLPNLRLQFFRRF